VPVYQFGEVENLRLKADELRVKADELRTQAEATRSPDARRLFLRLAASYDKLADRTQQALDTIKQGNG
jgi:hypothetical protein